MDTFASNTIENINQMFQNLVRIQYVSVQLLSRVRPFCDLMECSLPASSVHGISKARILEWVPFPTPGGLPDPARDLISCVSCIGRQGPYHSRQLGHPRVQYLLYQAAWFWYALATFQHNWKTLTFTAWYSLGKQFWGYLKNLLSFFFLLWR